MADKKFSDSDITKFIKKLIELGDFYVVEDSPNLYIRDVDTGKQCFIPCDGKKTPLAIYGTVAEDAAIVNPFAEGQSDAAMMQWFNLNVPLKLSNVIILIMAKILKEAIESIDNKEYKPNIIAVRLLGKYGVDIDNKTMKEFEQLIKNPSDFFMVHYNKTTQTTTVTSSVFILSRRKAYPQIRVKTWDALHGIMCNLLGTDDLATFDYTSTGSKTPVLDGLCHVICDVYDAIKDGCRLIGLKVNTADIRSYFGFLELFYERSKWCVSSTPVSKQQTSSTGAWGMPNIAPAGMMPAMMGPFVPAGNNFNMFPGMMYGAPMGMMPGMPMAPNMCVPGQMPMNGMCCTTQMNMMPPALPNGFIPAGSVFIPGMTGMPGMAPAMPSATPTQFQFNMGAMAQQQKAPGVAPKNCGNPFIGR